MSFYNKRFALTCAAAVIGALTMTSGAQAQGQQFISIGTGGVTGVYYPVGGAVCRLVNQNRKEHGIRCSVESTGGSIFNLNALRGGEMELGVVQSDTQYQAANGTGPFADQGADDTLRSVFSLHPEPFTVLARADSGIKTFDDLKGKRVNIGNPGSGQRALMETVMEAKGWTTADFAVASELRPAEQSQALCDNNVDVIVYTVGHPNGSIQEATTTCAATLVSVEGEEIDGLLEANDYYFSSTIPGGMYTGNESDVKTFGVGATLVASANTPDEAVYQIVKAVFENFDDFKALHPALAILTPENMIAQGNSAPLHPGAERYYKEAGLL